MPEELKIQSPKQGVPADLERGRSTDKRERATRDGLAELAP
jgi:hypothetical protein